MVKLRPMVKKPKLLSYNGLEPKMRFGKGFSIKELMAVNIDPKKAKRLGIPVDKKRKTLYEENVQALKNFIASKQ